MNPRAENQRKLNIGMRICIHCPNLLRILLVLTLSILATVDLLARASLTEHKLIPVDVDTDIDIDTNSDDRMCAPDTPIANTHDCDCLDPATKVIVSPEEFVCTEDPQKKCSESGQVFESGMCQPCPEGQKFELGQCKIIEGEGTPLTPAGAQKESKKALSKAAIGGIIGACVVVVVALAVVLIVARRNRNPSSEVRPDSSRFSNMQGYAANYMGFDEKKSEEGEVGSPSYA